MTEKITLEEVVFAPIDEVWKKWNAEEDIKNWYFANNDWHCPEAKNDLKPGVKFSYTLAAKDGSMSFDFSGTYDQILPKEKIDYTLDDGRKATVEFVEANNATRVMESFDPEESNSREAQEKGWQAILLQFKKYAEEK